MGQKGVFERKLEAAGKEIIDKVRALSTRQQIGSIEQEKPVLSSCFFLLGGGHSCR